MSLKAWKSNNFAENGLTTKLVKNCTLRKNYITSNFRSNPLNFSCVVLRKICPHVSYHVWSWNYWFKLDQYLRKTFPCMKNVVLSYLEKIEITLIFFIKLNTVGKFNEKKRCASKSPLSPLCSIYLIIKNVIFVYKSVWFVWNKPE